MKNPFEASPHKYFSIRLMFVEGKEVGAEKGIKEIPGSEVQFTAPFLIDK